MNINFFHFRWYHPTKIFNSSQKEYKTRDVISKYQNNETKNQCKNLFSADPKKIVMNENIISEPTVIIWNKKSTQKLIFRRSTKIVMNKDKWTQTNYPYLLQLPSTLLIIRHFITAVFSSPVGINPKKK